MGQRLIKGGWGGFVRCDPGVPSGICEQTWAAESTPPAFVWPQLQSAAADLVIMLLKEFLGGHSDHKEPRNRDRKPEEQHIMLSDNPAHN